MKLDTKDYRYIILILALCIAGLLFRGQMDSSEVVNVISIGTGITSIFLAMVSIWYSFRQNDDALRWNALTRESLDGIASEVKKLTEIADEFRSLRDEVVSFRQMSESGFANVENILGEIKKVSDILEKQNVPTPVKTEIETSLSEIKANLAEVVNEHEARSLRRLLRRAEFRLEIELEDKGLTWVPFPLLRNIQRTIKLAFVELGAVSVAVAPQRYDQSSGNLTVLVTAFTSTPETLTPLAIQTTFANISHTGYELKWVAPTSSW